MPPSLSSVNSGFSVSGSVTTGSGAIEVYLLGPVPFINAALVPLADLPPSIKFIFVKYILSGTLNPSVATRFL